MPAKIKDFGVVSDGLNEYHNYVFHCPGCGNDHPFRVGAGRLPTWTWNGSFDRPTFQPSLLCNQGEPGSRCHSYVRDGRIEFLADCWHGLAGQTVELPDYDD